MKPSRVLRQSTTIGIMLMVWIALCHPTPLAAEEAPILPPPPNATTTMTTADALLASSASPTANATITADESVAATAPMFILQGQGTSVVEDFLAHMAEVNDDSFRIKMLPAGGVNAMGMSATAVSRYKSYALGATVAPESAWLKSVRTTSQRVYASKRAELQSKVTYTYAQTILKRAVASVSVGNTGLAPDAAAHLARFLSNTGNPLTLDFARMLREDSSAYKCLLAELRNLQEAAEILIPDGSKAQYITGVADLPNPSTNCITKFNWLFAVGSYNTWIRAAITRTGTAFTARGDYGFRDMYDWKPGSWMPGGIVVDGEMSKLHYWGLAREYEITGTAAFTVNWKKGQRV